MKIPFLLCIISLFFAAFVESSAKIGSCAISEDVIVEGKTILAGTYTIRIDDESEILLQFLKGDDIVASEPAIVLPARGPDELTVSIVKTAKQQYVRIRARNDNTWYIVYLPVTQHSSLITQHS